MPRQVGRIHADLHEIGRVCLRKSKAEPTAAERLLLGRIARSFVRLYRDYPDARFRIDDEGAGMLSVLLVARVDLGACSPPAAAILDRALPARLGQPVESYYSAIVDQVPEAVLIGLIVLAVLACPTMMWLGRRGIGPGCGTATCAPEPKDESLESLERRQQELDRQIAELEPDARSAEST